MSPADAGTPPSSGGPRSGSGHRRALVEAAVRENEAELGRPREACENGAGPPDRRRPRASLRGLLLLIPVAGAATLGYLELNRPEAGSPAGPVAESAPPEAGIVFTGPLAFTEPPAPLDPDVFPLPVRRIVLDPGHGGAALGTAAEGLTEKALALDIAHRLRDLLAENYGVALTREADLDLGLERRALIANRAGADLFISIHVNWLTGNRSCGVETYYLGPTDDPELTALAERENSEAHGYSLGDLRRILDQVYAQARQEDSRALAAAVQESLFERLSAANPDLGDRGVKSAPFVVLIGAEMPAILAEVSCLSDADEVERLRDESHLQAIAEALNAGIRSYADSLLPEARTDGGGAKLPGGANRR